MKQKYALLNGCRLVRVNRSTSTLSMPLLRAGLFCNLFFFLTQPNFSGRKICSEIFCTKLKTVCSSQKKNLSQVLSIAISVDLTFRFSHRRISSLETDTKRLKKGKPAFFKEKKNQQQFVSLLFLSANEVLLHRQGKMDRKLGDVKIILIMPEIKVRGLLPSQWEARWAS